MSINALSTSLSCGMYMDPEYQRIIRQLMAYGISPSGDKSADKIKLQRIEQSKESQNSQFSQSGSNKEKSNTEISENQFKDNGQGTDQLAMLNKLKLGLL